MQDNNLLAAIDDQKWLDSAGDGLRQAAESTFKATGKEVEDFLHGTWLGHPLHTVITDIPVGAWSTAFVLDIMESAGNESVAPGADAAVAVGLVGAVGAAITGITDWQYTQDKPARVGVAHAMLNGTGTLLYGASLLLRKRGSRRAGRVTAALGYALVSAGAYLGGHLVYDEHLGIDRSSDDADLAPQKFTPVVDESELEDGKPARAMAGGLAIVLVKEGGSIYALADRCAHMGGPLSEGDVDGDAITCPWHGSRFCLKDGALLEGPSVYPQQSLETRVHNGKVEVRGA